MRNDSRRSTRLATPGRGSGLGDLLERNTALRGIFADRPELRQRLEELRAWQAERLLRTHADLNSSARYRRAVGFFFGELYGGKDPRSRDRDLQKVQRIMERLLPAEALQALTHAIELEILTQELDAAMVRALPEGPITERSYRFAYRRAGSRADRERQIALLHEVGMFLDHVVRKPLTRALVRFARGPAHAAGVGTLQEFLERGLDAFESMHGAREFLDRVRERETQALETLYAGDDDGPLPDAAEAEPIAKPGRSP
jgi:hypothetical protein